MKFSEIDDPSFVPFDIETTGFRAAEDNVITNVVLHNDGAYHIWINVDDIDTEIDREEIETQSGLSNFVVYKSESERDMLRSIGDYLDANTDDNTILTAFNGETYRGDTDFDLPFLRTRCLRNGVEWILDGFWYTDTFEVLSKKSRFDTTIKSEPSLEKMKKTDIQQFIDDMDYNIEYSKKKKSEIQKLLKSNDTIDADSIVDWCNNNLNENYTSFSKVNKSDLTTFIDEKGIDIKYYKMSKKDMIRRLREQGFRNEELIEWYDITGREIGNEEATTLDDIHEVLLEDLINNGGDWMNTVPVNIEEFEPFDPFESSGEAVTQYIEGNYEGVILHCFADVARTVNITRIMDEYVPKYDYKPKVL